MKFLYLTLNLGSLLIPLIFSFHPKIQFYKKIKSLLFASLISGFVYISWDVYFTEKGVWGFNESYLLGIYFFNLPLEEWLFFLCIPYASVFTHYVLTDIYPNLRLSKKVTNYVFSLIISVLALAIITQSSKYYTSFNSICTGSILLLVFFKKRYILESFFITFLVILIPFFIVNGVLTGSFIDQEVVWYNNLENLNFRLFTIPVEDVFYALGLILLTIFFVEIFEEKSTVK